MSTNQSDIVVGEVNVWLVSRHSLVLDTCYYVPSFIKNIILIYFLNKLGYNFKFVNNGYSTMMNDGIIWKGTLTNSLFILSWT